MVCIVIGVARFSRLVGVMMVEPKTQDAMIIESRMNMAAILVGIACQILGVLLLMSRMIVPQHGLIAMGIWLLLLGMGLLLYASAPSRYRSKQDASDKTPSVNRHKVVKPCPEHNGLCEYNLSCVHSGPCPLSFDHCPEGPQR